MGLLGLKESGYPITIAPKSSHQDKKNQSLKSTHTQKTNIWNLNIPAKKGHLLGFQSFVLGGCIFEFTLNLDYTPAITGFGSARKRPSCSQPRKAPPPTMRVAVGCFTNFIM